MEHAVAVFDSDGLLNLQKMREEQKRVNENFIVQEPNVIIDQQIIDQVIILHNEPFASIFYVDDSGTLFEGINSPIFELYLFQ